MFRARVLKVSIHFNILTGYFATRGERPPRAFSYYILF
ncbi:hypothetical protein DCCM_2631 [Desulfocucumis palustris]|uniref:Uncharacterized protein n=1 Tax=Desulfocucumis palustris TaxID=1898651 RepID=A0A2L2XB58_9FIRM|nr:hypothetical protein DCCM_2631 [Desulfocucumis palustris]